VSFEDNFLAELDLRTWHVPLSPPPEMLPEITEDDVHLVGWLAMVPSTPKTIVDQIGELPLGERL
jgi:hypothetical protein